MDSDTTTCWNHLEQQLEQCQFVWHNILHCKQKLKRFAQFQAEDALKVLNSKDLYLNIKICIKNDCIFLRPTKVKCFTQKIKKVAIKYNMSRLKQYKKQYQI